MIGADEAHEAHGKAHEAVREVPWAMFRETAGRSNVPQALDADKLRIRGREMTEEAKETKP